MIYVHQIGKKKQSYCRFENLDRIVEGMKLKINSNSNFSLNLYNA